MKKIIGLLLILSLGTVAFAQGAIGIQSVSPKTPKTMGMGGAFKVFSTGYESFFGNPAGFASEKGSLTIADLGTWVYFKPTQENIDRAMAIANEEATESQMASYLGDFVINNGLGAGLSLGLGWAGRGFGLGVNVVSDNVAFGTSFLGAKVASRTQATAVAGIGLPIKFGPFRLKLGADARAYYLLNSPFDTHWKFTDIAQPMISGGDVETAVRNLDIIGGYGFAFDAGLTFGIGPFSIGAVLRDYGLEFNMKTTTVGAIMDATMVPTDGTEPYVLTPSLSVGAAVQLGGKLLAPSLFVEAEDALGLVEDGFETVWTHLHAGAELKLLNFIALRAGMNKGWISVGAGIDLLFLEVDAALFTEEMGVNPGDFGRTGLAVQVAVRL